MLFEHQHPHNKSLTVSVIGPPNVGKSTLINCYMGMDFSIVTSRPQTTRNRFQCVALIDHTELIFVDTPGVHLSNQEINIRMNGQARDSLSGADLNILILDLSLDVRRQWEVMLKYLPESWAKTWVVFNKADRVQDPKEREKIPHFYEELKSKIPLLEQYFVLSAKDEGNVYQLTGALLDEAPSRPHRFKDGNLSNKSERFFITEYIRKEAFEILQQEVPYELAVQVDEFKTEGDDVRVAATLLVNRPSQRAIVVGSKGANIKTIGTEARRRIEDLLEMRVHLKLHVKVVPGWFNKNNILESLGLPRTIESKRVWRREKA